MADPDRRSRPNHLAGETSPYLLQHLFNPVDWYPWGDEALDRARREDKPIFLSIGYAACHWCHVMERESFEDEAVAAFLNEHFVSIKVDREERPDVDEIYMTAVHLLTGTGGWPLSVFLTPDREPFFGGTYFPPSATFGRPGFLDILARVADAWKRRRSDVALSAGRITEHLRRAVSDPGPRGAAAPPGRAEIALAAAHLASRFDPTWGGFGSAPKFPPHGAIGLLLREHARSGETTPLSMAVTTLDAMASGGIYDQFGGGFARYSTDDRWLVPHFEKMLYDQALLVPVYVDAWLLTGKRRYRRVVEETLDFVRREMTDPAGGFWSSLDADSEGREGIYYLWTPEEVDAALGPEDGPFLRRVYGIEEGGNFEGKSIPSLLGGSLEARAPEWGMAEEGLEARLAPLRSRLLAARARRVRPATDDKILTAWNGLMIGAFARAFQALGRAADGASAKAAAGFALREMRDGGRWLAAYRAGKAHLPAYLDDHAFLARGLLDLYEASFERRWLDAAAAVARTMTAHFADGDGGFFFTANDHPPLLARSRSAHDGALPAGSGVAAETLLRLAAHLGDREMRASAERTLQAMQPLTARNPSAFAALLAAADFSSGPVVEIALAGSRTDPTAEALVNVIRSRYLPNRIVARASPGEAASDLPLLRDRPFPAERATAWVCRGYACQAPAYDPLDLAARLDAAR